MRKDLIIVFAKNILLGKVKTRLAISIGDQAAFEIYKHLVELTEQETARVNSADVHVYFSDVIIEEKWPDFPKYVQEGKDLGERMYNAFKQGFDLGYERIIGIGSDLPDITAEIMKEGIHSLDESDVVFGPAEDGGYYLLGMTRLIPEIFRNKAWSTETLLRDTLQELESLNYSVTLLTTLNDVDTLEDLERSSIGERFSTLISSSQK